MGGDREDFEKRRRKKQLDRLRGLGGNRGDKKRTNRRDTSSKIERYVDKSTGEIPYRPSTLRRNSDKSPKGYNPLSGNERGEAGDGSNPFDSRNDANQPDTKGDLISLKVEVNFNESSWSGAVGEIKALEEMIHSIDYDRDFFEMTGVVAYEKKRLGLKHFKGVYKMMNEMAVRSVTSVPPLFPVWKEYVASMNAANFGSSGLPVGGWAPYDAEYAAIAGPKPDLVRTGMLSFSLTSGLLVENVRGDQVEFGTRVEHAKFHQYGTTKMPARKIVFEPQGASKFFGGLVGRWVARERVSLNYESVG